MRIRPAVIATPMLVLGMLLGLRAAQVAAESAPYVLQVDLSAAIAALGSDDPFESEPAVERLVALGPITVPVLAVALRREGPAVRAGVVDVVRQFDDPAAASLLLEAARDQDAAVRADAVLALGLGRNAAGREIVEAALHDPDPQVRRSAMLACSRVCNSPDAFSLLVAAALAGREMPTVRHSLATALADSDATRTARMRDAIARQAVPALTAADRSQRFNAALTAALIGEPASVPILVAVIREGPPEQAVPAALALATVPSPDTVAALAEAARTGSPGVVSAACISLHNLKTLSAPGAAAASAPCPGAANAAAAAPPSVRTEP